MDDHARDALLDRIDRESATVGAEIPETISLEGESIALADRITSGETDASLRPRLRRERTRLREAIAEDRVDRETAETYVDRIAGLDRALAHLEGDGDIEGAAERAARADRQRWRSFVREVRGENDADARSR